VLLNVEVVQINKPVVPNQGSMDPHGVRGGSLGGTCLMTIITSLIKEED